MNPTPHDAVSWPEVYAAAVHAFSPEPFSEERQALETIFSALQEKVFALALLNPPCRPKDRLSTRLFEPSSQGAPDKFGGASQTARRQLSVHEPALETINVRTMRYDGVLCVIRATMAFSKIECETLQALTAAMTPHLALVITEMEHVPAEERAEVVSFIHSQAETLSPGCPLFFIGEDEASLEPLREQLAQWTKDASLSDRRKRQAMQRIATLLLQAREKVKSKAEEEQAQELKRAQALAEIELKRSAAKKVWAECQAFCLQKAAATIQMASESIVQASQIVSGDLCHSLKHAPDPEVWLKEDLPHDCERMMRSQLESLERRLAQRTQQDFKSLVEIVQAKFAAKGIATPNVTLNLSIDALSVETTGVNLGKRKMLLRIGSLLLAPILWSTIGPFAMLVSGGSGLIGEVIVHAQRKEVAERLAARLRLETEKAFADLGGKVRQRLDMIYGEIDDGLAKLSSLWMEDFARHAEQTNPEQPRLSLHLSKSLDALAEHLPSSN